MKGETRTALKLGVKAVSPLVGPAYARVRRHLAPVWDPLLQRVRHRGLRPADSFLASYPRSGNTWLRFMLFEALTGEAADFRLVRPAMPSVNMNTNATAFFPEGGRLFLTHYPFCDYYGTGKAIYLVRDVRDIVLSEYRRQLMNRSYRRDFDHFLEDFLQGRIHRFGSWIDHVTSWLDGPLGRDGRLLLCRYEDLKRNAESILEDVVRFLGERADPIAIRTAVENNTVEAMRDKEDHTRLPEARPGFRFVNEGGSGGWRQKLRADQLHHIEKAAGDILERLGYTIGGVSRGGP